MTEFPETTSSSALDIATWVQDQLFTAKMDGRTFITNDYDDMRCVTMVDDAVEVALTPHAEPSARFTITDAAGETFTVTVTRTVEGEEDNS